jgi:ribonuclease E
VNSGSTRGEKDLERTALRTNLEASVEIARQLRLRDIGGVVICDFIDMVEGENRRKLEQHFREQMRRDRAKTWFSRHSRFGIIELTRQRLRASKDRVGRETCPMCRGRGSVRSARSVAAAILRQLRRGLAEGAHQEAVVTVSEDVLDALVNRRRDDLVGLENEAGRRIVVLPGHDLGAQRFQIEFR